MRTLFVLTAVVILAPLAMARVWTSVYRCDEATPLAPVDANHPTVYRDIMVGTHLVIVVSSDAVEAWSGALRFSWDDANDATLGARGFDPESWNYEGSCLEAAGSKATVWESMTSAGLGFEYNNHAADATPGNWFVFDYRADQVGLVDLNVYHLTDSNDSYDVPIETLSFTHVASRDFAADGIVNFDDLALLARGWRSPVAPDANNPAARLDLDADGRTGIGDLALFAEYWLERTDCNEPATDPNNSPPAP
jgi:hypothetical protein